MSDARSQRADKFRQDKEKHAVMLQLQQQQLRAEEEAAAAAAGESQVEQAEGRPAAPDAAEDHSLALIIKADVQVSNPPFGILYPASFRVPLQVVSYPILFALPWSAGTSKAGACGKS